MRTTASTANACPTSSVHARVHHVHVGGLEVDGDDVVGGGGHRHMMADPVRSVVPDQCVDQFADAGDARWRRPVRLDGPSTGRTRASSSAESKSYSDSRQTASPVRARCWANARWWSSTCSPELPGSDSRDHDRSATGGPDVHDAAGTTRDHDHVGLFDLGTSSRRYSSASSTPTGARVVPCWTTTMSSDRVGPTLGPADEAIEGMVVGADAHEDTHVSTRPGDGRAGVVRGAGGVPLEAGTGR